MIFGTITSASEQSPACVVFIKRRIQLSVVAHGRIHKDQGIFTPEIPDQRPDHADLLLRPKVPGIDGVKLYALLFPVLRDRSDLVREILHGEALEHGVGTEHGRGQNDGLDTHSRDQGKGNGEGALPETGDILYCQNPFH